MNLTQQQFDELRRRPAIARLNPALGGVSSSAEPEPAVRHESLAEIPRTAQNGARFLVRIISLRTRLIDPDNLAGKFFLDCLKRTQVISDDSARVVDYSIRQEKVGTKAEERTVIELIRL